MIKDIKESSILDYVLVMPPVWLKPLTEPEPTEISGSGSTLNRTESTAKSPINGHLVVLIYSVTCVVMPSLIFKSKYTTHSL